MARSLSEIYAVAKKCRNNYLELTEFENSSKMSIIDAFTWVVSACIWTFENILDVFKVDLAKDLQYRINGTPAYFANALLKYQAGDELVMNDEGTAFSYPSGSTGSKIITKVSYYEEEIEGFHDNLICFKIATGTPGNYSRIDESEMVAIRAYLNKLLFAGQRAKIYSRIGDVLVPNLTVYHDGSVSEDVIYSTIEENLNEYIASIEFNGVIYVQKIIDSIQKVEYVTDVEIDNNAGQGIFIACYDDDNNLIVNEFGDPLMQIKRCYIPNSGYVKQSSGTGAETEILKWCDSIHLALETAKPVGVINTKCDCTCCPTDCECKQ